MPNVRTMAGDHLGPRSLRQLLDTVLAIGSELDLDAALRRIVEAAVSLVDARYGALGVLDESRTGWPQFITVGLDDEQLRAIGDLPKGLGLLGSLIADARPLRVPVLDEHPDAAGFPPNHPPMTSFLGVPIVARGEVFGNLYLTDKTSAEAFSDLDEQLAIGLAAAAGVVIENARLYGTVPAPRGGAYRRPRDHGDGRRRSGRAHHAPAHRRPGPGAGRRRCGHLRPPAVRDRRCW